MNGLQALLDGFYSKQSFMAGITKLNLVTRKIMKIILIM